MKDKIFQFGMFFLFSLIISFFAGRVFYVFWAALFLLGLIFLGTTRSSGLHEIPTVLGMMLGIVFGGWLFYEFMEPKISQDDIILGIIVIFANPTAFLMGIWASMIWQSLVCLDEIEQEKNH